MIIDGFPRNQDNLNWWLKRMAGVCRVNQLIHLDCGNDELRRRLMERKRSDDTEEIIETRIRNHIKESAPVLKYFDEQNLVTNLDGQKSKEEVYETLRQKVLPYLPKIKKRTHEKDFE
jgi:adenylate kinase